jgi:hypothetical protein
MGNDGGSIPKRRELVKEAAKNPTTAQLKETKLEKEGYHWTTDPLTNKLLREPIVSDCRGTLYNKDAVLEFLLPSSDPDDDAAAQRRAEGERLLGDTVKGLRDVVEVRFERDPDAPASEARWICPITNKQLGPGVKAVYLVPCGHAFEAVVVKEVGETKCLQCNEAYAPNDVIPIIPTSELDIARLELRMKTLKEKGLTHSLKKAPGSKKKRKNGGEKADAEEKGSKSVSSKSDKTNGSKADGIKNSSTASLTAKVLEEEDGRNKRRKLAQTTNLKGLFSSQDPSKPSGKSSDFMTRGFSISNK